jgi:hypothetical protein
LYSQPKHPRRQTSAHPSPPPTFLGPALEAVALALRIGFRRSRFAEQTAEIDEMLLRSLPLAQLAVAPLADKFCRGHAIGLPPRAISVRLAKSSFSPNNARDDGLS